MTTHRPCCGTAEGMLRHQAAGETPCGECARGEVLRQLEAERHAPPPRPWSNGRPEVRDWPEVTPEVAARNAADLVAEADRGLRALDGAA